MVERTADLQRALALSRDMPCTLDPTGRFLDLAPSWEPCLGYPLAQLRSMDPDDLVVPEDRATTRTSLRQVRETLGVVTFDARYRCRDGSPRSLSWRAQQDPDRGVTLAVARDVTERREATEALRESEERYRQLVELMPDGVAIHQDGVVQYANPAAARVIGVQDHHQLVGQVLLNWVHPDSLPLVKERLRTMHQDGRAVPLVEEKFLRVDGTGVEVEVAAIPFLVRGRRLVQVVFRDISERKRAQEDLQRLNVELEQRVAQRTAELEAANHELEAFSSSVSHDLRAPLRTLAGFSQALLEDYGSQLDDTGRDHLRRIDAAAQRMARLIGDLLQLARVSRAELNRGPVDVTGLAQEILAEFKRAEPSSVVETVVEPGLQADADPLLLRVVMENLLGNAWKFTSRHGRARIGLSGREEGGQTVFVVCDDGAGFDMRYVDRLFGPFQRLHTQEEFPGNGVGLATVQRVVRRHGGRVWAEGRVEGGATFSFTLG
jgi:PAS domain S-box-containing protein